MAQIAETEAVARARRRLGLDSEVAAATWRSRREDRPGDAYYLVVFGESNHARGVAAVDCAEGEVLEWAELAGTGPHLTVDAKEASRLAGAASGPAEMVWRPSRASRSLLYPIWRIETAAGAVYVDQQGTVWDSLEPGVTGG